MAGALERMRAERRAEPRGATRWRASSGAAAPRWRSNRFTRAFWPLGSALARRLGGAGLRARRDHHRGRSCMAAMGVAGLGAARAARLGRPPLPLAERGRRRGRGSTRRCPGGRWRRCADRPALGRDDPGAQAVWAAHLARMRRLAATARPVAADLRLAAPRPLGAAAGGAGGADRRGGLRARPRRRGGRRRRCSRRRARRWPRGRASRAGPSRRPIPGGRRSTCRRCRATRRWRCPRAPR